MILKPVFIIAIVLVAMIGIGVTPVYAELLEKQADAAILVKIFGDEFTFYSPNYQMKAPQIHFADGNWNSFHRYHEDGTMQLLFNSMDVLISDQCYVFPDGKSFCTNEDYSLKYFINDKLVSDIRNYIIQDNDRILIVFGGETDKQISEWYLSELNSIKIKSGDAVVTSNDFIYPDFKIPVKYTHYACIDNMNTDWKISFTIEMVMDDEARSPYPFMGITEECHGVIYTSNDGTVYAEWTENPNFELSDFIIVTHSAALLPAFHQLQSLGGLEVYVNDRVVETGLNTPLQDKNHYKMVLTPEPTPEPTPVTPTPVTPTPVAPTPVTPEPVVDQVVTCGTGTELVNGICQIIQTEEKSSKGGGCLIATATYGSEMATEVQQLRELRDNQLMNTESGTAFMGTFNDIYYSFSPTIADMEREHPMFKEAVKLAITPMISSLSLMENAESESEVLSIGISVIMLNLGMYLGVPAVVIVGIKKIK